MKRLPLSVAAAVVTLAVIAACGQGSESIFDRPLQASGHDGGDFDAGDVPDAQGSQGNAVPSCTPGATIIYVIDTADVLHSFDPTLIPAPSAMKSIGRMNCVLAGGGAWAGASSMAVDRNTVAWVTDKNGLLFKVNTHDATCQSTAFQNQQGFAKVGMGFAGDASSGTETLYLTDTSDPSISGNGKGLATLDLASLKLSPIANFDGTFAGSGAELTGSGDGRLFGFFPVLQKLARIDPKTAHIISSIAVSASAPYAGAGEYDFAFSFWGGVFFVYTSWPGGDVTATTDVSEVDPVSGKTTIVMPRIGFNIVGAGSSICVPTVGDVREILGAASRTEAGPDAELPDDARTDLDGFDQ